MQPISLSVDEACQSLGIGRTLLYRLISEKKIESFKVGRRTLISHAGLHAYVMSEMEKAA